MYRYRHSLSAVKLHMRCSVGSLMQYTCSASKGYTRRLFSRKNSIYGLSSVETSRKRSTSSEDDSQEGDIPKRTTGTHLSEVGKKSSKIRTGRDILGRRKSLSPSGRLGNLLGKDFWQNHTTYMKDEVESLGKSASDIASHDSSSISSNLAPPLITGIDMISAEGDHFQEGELAILKRPRKNDCDLERLVELQKHSVFKNKHFGAIRHDDIISTLKDSCLAVSDRDISFSVSRATLNEYLKLFYRNTASADPSVLTNIFYNLGIQPGDKVLECGSGSGIATLLLSQLVGHRGRVESFDKTDIAHLKAQETVTRWRDSYNVLKNNHPWPSNVCFHHQDLGVVTSAIGQFDFVFLDLMEPRAVLQVAAANLRSGGCIGLYSPSPTKIISAMQTIQKLSLPLVLEETWEEGLTEWHISQRIKGKNKPSLAWPKKDDEATVFIAKFRKTDSSGLSPIKTASSDDVSPFTTTDNPLRLGDDVIVMDYQPRKKARRRLHQRRLAEGGKFLDQHGVLAHTEIVGREEGAVLMLSVGHKVYPVRPCVRERLDQSQIAKKFNGLQSRCFNLLRHLTDIRDSDTVLEIAFGPGPLTVLLSKAVGPSGSIASLYTHSSPEDAACAVKQYEHDLGHPVCSQTIGHVDPVTGNITLNQPIPSGSVFSAVCVFVRDPVDYLAMASRYLPIGGRLGVMCWRIGQVQDILDYLHEHKATCLLQVTDVVEDRERRWIIQPVKNPLNRNIDPTYADIPYICRPRQGLLNPTGFLVILKKTKVTASELPT